MSLNLGEKGNFCLRLIPKLGNHHALLSSWKKMSLKKSDSCWNATSTKSWKSWSRKKISSLKWVIYNGRRKTCIAFKTDNDTVEVSAYWYWKTFIAKIRILRWLYWSMNTFYRKKVQSELPARFLHKVYCDGWTNSSQLIWIPFRMNVFFLATVILFYWRLIIVSFSKNAVRKNLFLGLRHILDPKICPREMDF